MSETGHSRRRLLGGAGLSALSLAGCGLLDDDEPAPPATPDALQPLLDEAVALAAAYDRAVIAQPGLSGRLAPLAANHREHAGELSKLIGAAATTPVTAASVSAPPAASASAPPAVALADLRAAEQAAQKNAAAACAQAPADRVALVGSIAAGRATHAEALR
ncbi:MAG: hypothetical protein ABW046_03635 [Actinoplanes sp.]